MRIQAMKDQKEQCEAEQCTFTPNSMGRSKSYGKMKPQQQRSTQQFLHDQFVKEQERIMKINMNLEENMKKEFSKVSATPQITHKSKVLAERKNKSSFEQVDVHQRLYDQTIKKQYLLVQKENQQPHDENSTSTFRPQIQKKSKRLRRDKPIQDHLYEDALKRKIKQENVQFEY